MVVRSEFRPCIDLHGGEVKQIVGGTFEKDESRLRTNFVAKHPPSYYASLYRKHNLKGGHVIKLGPGNDAAAQEALEAWPNGLHIGGGIHSDNAQFWIEKGAEKVIVTSYLFPDCRFSMERLLQMENAVGKDRLVVDISCRRRGDDWIVAMNRWQDLTDMTLSKTTLDQVSQHCSELLIHAADVEGLCQGIDQQLVERLAEWVSIPTTYAGGARRMSYLLTLSDLEDLQLVNKLSQGKVHLTFGSALDIFGGSGVKLEDLVHWNHSNR